MPNPRIETASGKADTAGCARVAFSMIPFHKLQGAGNDFVVLDLFSQPLPATFDFARAAITLCDRHFGVGSDGLLTLEPSTNGVPLRMRMWNPDGSEDMCGNGLRCVGALAWRQKYVETPKFAVQTIAGTRQIEILSLDLMRIAMGQPLLLPSEVPVALPDSRGNAIDFEIDLGDTILNATSLSTGSTHTVIFLSQPLSDQQFQTWSPLLENHPIFPTRSNIMWVVPDGNNRFRLRIWERGAHETLACGTGACAVAVAATMTGRATGPVEIESPGGVLNIDWTPGQQIWMTGPAKYVFSGLWEDESLGQ